MDRENSTILNEEINNGVSRDVSEDKNRTVLNRDVLNTEGNQTKYGNGFPESLYQDTEDTKKNQAKYGSGFPESLYQDTEDTKGNRAKYGNGLPESLPQGMPDAEGYRPNPGKESPEELKQDRTEAGEIAAGTVLCGKYTVSHRMEVSTGEADLYICRRGEEAFVAKIYRRRESIKPEVSDLIKSLESPYIAKVHETGTYNSCFLEILSFYKNGSLEGRRFDFRELKEHIIPCLNEGLRVLHGQGIIHKDLKPSNIMVTDNRDRVVIIDFGISSIREKGNTIIMTRTGMTPEYSAPETFRNLYLEESDYYSLGITIYELYCGSAPFRNMEPEEIERYISVQKIPFPKEMPNELKDLISALTYYDITNRKEKTNPNRRWGYAEVKRWCDGEKMMIPGEGTREVGGIPPYIFCQTAYIDKQELVYAFAEHWEEGKKQLFRGLLSAYFKTFDPQAAGHCLDAEEEAAKLYGKEELLYWKTLYHLSVKTRELFWRGKIYPGLSEFGNDLLTYLYGDHEGQEGINEFYGSLLENRILSAYIEQVEPGEQEMTEAVRGLESAYRSHYKRRDKMMYLFICGYMLSGKPVLYLDGKKFETISGLISYTRKLMQDSYEEFVRFCCRMIDEENNPEPCLEGWLIALGKEDKLVLWRDEI